MPNPPFWCSITVCTALPYRGEQVLSLLTWVQVAKDCSAALLVLGVLAVLTLGLGHLPWRFRLGGVLPLAGSGFAWIAAAHLQDTFGYVVQLEGDFVGTGPRTAYTRLELMISTALQGAVVLEWLVVGVTIVLLLVCVLVVLAHTSSDDPVERTWQTTVRRLTLPEAMNAIRIQGWISTHQRNLLEQCLRNEQAIKWIAVMKGK